MNLILTPNALGLWLNYCHFPVVDTEMQRVGTARPRSQSCKRESQAAGAAVSSGADSMLRSPPLACFSRVVAVFGGH